MKKIIISLILLAVSAGTQAQLQRGNYFVGASFNYWDGKTDNQQDGQTQQGNVAQNWTNHNRNLNGHINGGIFITDGLALGISMSYQNSFWRSGSQSVNGSSFSSQQIQTLSPGIFLRLYRPLNERFAVFIHPYGNYIAGEIQIERHNESPFGSPTDDIEKGQIRGYSFGLRPGIAFFITKKMALEAMLGDISYTHRETTPLTPAVNNNKQTENNFQMGFSFPTVFIGFNLYLGKTQNPTVHTSQ